MAKSKLEKFKHTKKRERTRIEEDDEEIDESLEDLKNEEDDEEEETEERTREEKLDRQEELKVKREGRKPWKPARTLEIPAHLKDSRFVYRFVERLRPGNLRKKIDEGWEIDTKLGKKLNEMYGGLQKTLDDGSPIDSTVQIRELIVLRMPKVIHEERAKYYHERSNINKETIKGDMNNSLRKTADEMKGKGEIPANEEVYSGGVYGNYHEEHKTGG